MTPRALAIALLCASLALLAGPLRADDQGRTAIATFAGGCFWCTEADFDKVPGVLKTISGYMGGHVENPTYRQVANGGTGHAEVVRVIYDPTKITYAQLLEAYWPTIDPHDKDGQFCDRGDQYRPEIFVHDDEQKRLAEASKAKLEASGKLKKPVVVAITKASKFTEAEAYHQNFYKTNPARYWSYRIGCGRDRRLEAVWGPKPKS